MGGEFDHPDKGSFFSHLTGSDYMNLATADDVSNQINFTRNYLVDANDDVYFTNDVQLSGLITPLTAPASGSGISAESNAIYFIFTTPKTWNNVGIGECGDHSDTYTGNRKYVWVGTNHGAGCGGESAVTAADGVTSTASHELFETLTDPLIAESNLNAPPLAWYDVGRMTRARSPTSARTGTQPKSP